MSVPSLILEDLARAPDEFARLLKALPDGIWDFEPSSWEECPGERFTVRGNICHLRDIELDGYRQRFARTLTESNPHLPSVDSYGLAEKRRYVESDPHEALAAFRRARAETLDRVRRFTAAELARPAVFEGYGPVTLGGLVHYLSAHDRQHVACFHWLLGKHTDAS